MDCPIYRGDKGYHSTGFDWGPTVGNDETKMADYQTARWAVEQFRDRQFDKPFFMAVGISKPHLTVVGPFKNISICIRWMRSFCQRPYLTIWEDILR